jgi:hypothetical protein
MAELTDTLGNNYDELLTPKHSIPPDIRSLNVSGSRGRFSDNHYFPLTIENQSFANISHDTKQYKFDRLYLDAAKRSAAREKLNLYALSRIEKEAETLKTDKKLTKNQSLDLFERLNKEAENRQQRQKITKKIKEAQEIKELKNPAINKTSLNLQQNVVTRLLQYGENSKRKLEERIRIKQIREEEEIKNIPSVHKKGKSEVSTPNKILPNEESPSKITNFSTKSKIYSQETPSKIFQSASRSSNSPEKVIKKIQNLTREPKSGLKLSLDAQLKAADSLKLLIKGES